MKGYDVVTSEGQKVGRVVDVLDGFVVVEIGRVLRSRRPLPKEFAHAQDGQRAVVVTVPTKVLQDAPRVHRNGTFDVDAAARHYGLAASDRRDEGAERALAEQRERESEETGPEPEGAAPLTKQPEDEIERRPERVYMPGGE
ncbi:MAG TPA: PRC-barrel domain-containing protein [Gaiellaceae bacterium]|nr:PRC-barrel domain-containing protein [Gaiellaceae bacterium]